MPKGPPREHRKALAMLIFANLFWGLSFPSIKSLELLNARLVPDANGWFYMACVIGPRFAVSLLVLLIWQALQHRNNPKLGPALPTSNERRQGVLVGAFAAVGMLLQSDGLRFTAASTCAFLTQFYAIMIPVWLAARHRKNPGFWTWSACILVVSGTAILGHFNWHQLTFGRGEWETLASSVFFMFVIFTLESPGFQGNRPGKVTLVMFAVETVVFVGLALASAPRPAALLIPWASAEPLAFALILALFCTVGPFSLMNAWQPKITATEAGLIYCLEPIFSSLFALFMPEIYSHWAGVDYLNETTTLPLLVGGTLIILANVLLQVRPVPGSLPPPATSLR